MVIFVCFTNAAVLRRSWRVPKSLLLRGSLGAKGPCEPESGHYSLEGCDWMSLGLPHMGIDQMG